MCSLLFCAEMALAKKEYEFLAEIGLGPLNLGGYVNGSWKAHGPVVSTVNPANNQVAIPSPNHQHHFVLSCSVRVHVCLPV